MAKKARRGRGEGGCFQRESDGLWVATLSLGFKPNGKRSRVVRYGKSKREALEKVAEARAAAGAGGLPDAGSLTVGQLLVKWLDNLRGRAGARTVEEREKVIRTHLALRVGRLKLAKLNSLHVESLFAQMRADGVKPGAVRSAAKHLVTALHFAVRLRLIPHSPAAGLQMPAGPKRQMVVLDSGQARVVAVAAAAVPTGAVVVAALYSGCRQSELLALEWPDVDLRAGTLSITKALSKPKGGFVVVPPKSAAGRRVVALPPFAVESLVAHKAAAIKAGRKNAPVFASLTGGYRHPNQVRVSLARLVRRLNRSGIDRPVPAGFRFHDLRHTHASLLISAGYSLRAVSARLGHRDPALTLRVYSHLMPTDDATLAAGFADIIG